MNINQVIESGEKIVLKEQHFLPLSAATEWSMIIGAVIFCLVLIICFGLFSGFRRIGLEGCLRLFMVAYIISFAFTYITFKQDYEKIQNKYVSEVEKWKKEQAYPYIKALPIEKLEIMKIETDSKAVSKTNIFKMFPDVNDNKLGRTPLTLSFKVGDEVFTITESLQTSMELSNEEKPYIEFQNLERDLGHGVNAGAYNAKVHLPKSFALTNINN
ncbi:hypothetical protein [Paenibacillus polymyxa]|uniref:Uncharacterized protein n=1 Tax=Paenibacillus polymyxa (strain SC2) TaxID=886882 RepID=E3EK27_PAEPS|nr:hypothetical protein [Paenibacillus polymyxa]ADO59736.1 hypothetical protein PPSC2_26490 [Paenibacillus polymyxa SC2]WPQ60027.1 hypothetical protein SKN87_27680 [Paenibacillus polymyxa]